LQIHQLVDVLRRLAAPIVVTSGNVSDITIAPVLLEDVENTAVVGDKVTTDAHCVIPCAVRTANLPSRPAAM
jgi:hypothetical protein